MQYGLSPEEIEQFVNLDSANSITLDSEFLYRFAALIPNEIIDYLLSFQGEDQYYFGSVLRVTRTDSESFYTLGFYTFGFSSDGNFLIGRTNYGLTNFQVDYLPYVDSPNYIYLNINKNNIETDSNFFAQGFKMNRLYGICQVDRYSEEVDARTALFDEDKTFVYYALDTLEKNYLLDVPNEVYNRFSVTPSVLKLAKYNPFDAALANKAKSKAKKAKSVVKKSACRF